MRPSVPDADPLPGRPECAGTARGQRRAQPGPRSSRARQPVVNVYVVIVHTQCCKTVTLCCEILSSGHDAGVSDEHRRL